MVGYRSYDRILGRDEEATPMALPAHMRGGDPVRRKTVEERVEPIVGCLLVAFGMGAGFIVLSAMCAVGVLIFKMIVSMF